MEAFGDLTRHTRGSFAADHSETMPGQSHDNSGWVDKANQRLDADDVEQLGPKQFGMPGELQKTQPADPNVSANVAELLARGEQLPKQG